MDSTFNVWFSWFDNCFMHLNSNQFEGLNVQSQMNRTLRTGQYDPYGTFCIRLEENYQSNESDSSIDYT